MFLFFAPSSFSQWTNALNSNRSGQYVVPWLAKPHGKSINKNSKKLWMDLGSIYLGIQSPQIPPPKNAKIQVEPFACWKTWWIQCFLIVICFFGEVERHERISPYQVVFNRKGSTFISIQIGELWEFTQICIVLYLGDANIKLRNHGRFTAASKILLRKKKHASLVLIVERERNKIL